ncbi:MAG: TGS domain-containing protein, partial [Pseudomonadota bacterium]
ELDRAGVRHEITGRAKHIYSIWRKMQRKGAGIDAIFDLRAVRVLVDDVAACYAALGIVHNLWPYLPQEFDDYIANPKPNLYRSLHTAVVGPDGDALEVQIRTHEMHAHAELGVAAHWRYKEGGSATPAFEQKIRWLRELLEPGGAGARGDSEFFARVREEILEDRVYAISPKGDIIDLPAGATPLDFAYQVHTQIGHRCRGAKVNGRIVNLTYNIRNGDQIEIITGREPAPSRDWLVPRLGYLASTRSRTKVRSWFRAQDRDQNRKQGREILERELQRLNERDRPLAEIAKHLKFDGVEQLYVALGAGDVTAASIASALQQLVAPPQQPRRRRRKPAAETVGEQTVTGVGDLLSQFARCCRPIPPEAIGGYITQGRGVTIHRLDCGNFVRLREREPRRILDVHWGGERSERYTTGIRVEAQDRNGLLRDVSAILSDENIAILDSTTRIDRREQRALFNMTVGVDDLQTLSRALNRIASLPGVAESQRTGST